MKKIMVTLAVSALLVTSMSATAFGANNVSATVAPQQANIYPICAVDGCNKTEVHQHDRKNYAKHTIDDGHTYHQFCTVAECTQAGTHVHDGKTYFAHQYGDRHHYHANQAQQNVNGGHHGHHKSGRHHQ